MASKSLAGEGLIKFVHIRWFGRAMRQENGIIRKYSIDYHVSERNCPNHNFAEGVIQEGQKKWFRIMVRRKVPQRLWDYRL